MIKLCSYPTETEGKKTAWEVGEGKTEPRKKWRGNDHLCETSFKSIANGSPQQKIIKLHTWILSVLQGEDDAQQSKADESKPVNDASKNNTNSSVKQLASVKDTDSSDGSEDESSDEDSDTKGDSEVPTYCIHTPIV